MGKSKKKAKGAQSAAAAAGFNAGPRASAQRASANFASGGGRGRGGPGGGGSQMGRGRGRGMSRNTRQGSMFGRSSEPKDVIKGVEDISKAKWYVGKTSRVEVDKAVLAGNVGDWLVRMSSKGDTYVICINDSGSCQNFQVHIKGKKFAMGGVEFNSVMECLMYLRSNPINGKAGRLYYLGKPASDYDWYVGAMAKTECDKMVLAAGKSDFLIRLASDKKDYVLCVNQGNGKAKNCKIFTGGMPNSFTLGSTTEKNLEDLIDTLKDVAIPTNDGSANLYLRKPAAKADYYAGQMPRAEAEGYVKKGATGDYLIRQNTKGDKYVLVVNDNKSILNFIISQTADGKFEFGGLPHNSLEMVIRYLKKAPLASKSGGQVFINRAARMTNADDMIADVQFGFGDDESEDEEPRARPDRSGLGGGGGGSKNPPMFDSDDEEEDEEDEEDYDDATETRFEPFRVKSTREITGICQENVGLFVIAEKGDDKYLAVYNGEQVEVPRDAVERESERKASVVEIEDDEDDEEEDGFGEEDEEEEEEEEDAESPEEKEARLAAAAEERKAAMAAKVEEAKAAALAKLNEEAAGEEAALMAEMEAAKAKMAELGGDDEDFGFGDNDEDDD